MENIGFIIKVIADVVDLALPTRQLNVHASDEKRAFIVMIMDECHKIIRLNSNISPNVNPSPSDTNSNINTKEVN
jgi:hypothetical protein